MDTVGEFMRKVVIAFFTIVVFALCYYVYLNILQFGFGYTYGYMYARITGLMPDLHNMSYWFIYSLYALRGLAIGASIFSARWFWNYYKKRNFYIVQGI
jgi:hypothetical protein